MKRTTIMADIVLRDHARAGELMERYGDLPSGFVDRYARTARRGCGKTPAVRP